MCACALEQREMVNDVYALFNNAPAPVFHTGMEECCIALPGVY